VTTSASPAQRRSAQAHDAAPKFAPTQVLDVELTEPLPALRRHDRYQRVLVLARLHTEPIGACVVELSAELTPDLLGARLWSEFGEPVTARFATAGLAAPGELSAAGLAADPATWPFLRRRREVLATAPTVSVVICTRDRPAQQLNACLNCLREQQYPRYDVVVVDNAPTSDTAHAVVASLAGDMQVRYIVEPRPGLSWARNAGIAAATGEIIAFLDDDEEPDLHWLAELACGFARGPDIGCVSGVVLPARLDTPAQELFQRLGGHSKGRDFCSTVFSRHGPQSPLYPLPPFGVGANMAFRREVLARVGGFDVALGAGTPALAGEDTLALTLALLAGYRIVYQPSAVMRHYHRSDLASLSRQMEGYSVGLTAFYAALVRRRPSTLLGLALLLPRALRYLRSAAAAGGAATPADGDAGFKRRHRWLMLTGPVAYLRSLRQQARADAALTRANRTRPASGSVDRPDGSRDDSRRRA
jgi:glycosyltransferase involved in cell wall biosynthesis